MNTGGGDNSRKSIPWIAFSAVVGGLPVSIGHLNPRIQVTGELFSHAGRLAYCGQFTILIGFHGGFVRRRAVTK
jgi:hypothetical protein